MDEEIKQYRPFWVEPEFLKTLGFDLIKDQDGYLQYSNDGKNFFDRHYNKDYPLPKGKRIIYINCTYSPNEEVVFVGVREDGGTRSCYNGICGDENFFKLLIENTK